MKLKLLFALVVVIVLVYVTGKIKTSSEQNNVDNSTFKTVTKYQQNINYRGIDASDSKKMKLSKSKTIYQGKKKLCLGGLRN